MDEKPTSKKVVWIKKQQIDSTACFSYALGTSVVHLSMFFLCLAAKRADVEKAKGFHSACQAEAETYDNLQSYFLVVHLICFCACMYREIFTSEVGLTGLFLNLIQMLLIPVYLFPLLQSH